jgi:CheY-like chemotaxis protein
MMQMRTDDEKLLTSIRHILTAADRSAELTSKMLAFASESRSKHAPFDAHAELSDAVRLIQPTLSDTITVQLALDATSATVMGDAEQFRQAVVELMSNARDAMPDGGELCISSRNERVRQRNVLSDKQVIEPGDYILLTVTDTGCGIPFQARDHIFEPFFTTKDPASATGMGLSAVYGIVTGHGGGIDVSSSAEGTAVRLHLPLTDTAGDRQTEPTAAKAAPGSSHQAPQQRTKSVLLVDDEVYIRNAMELILRELGYRITTCASIAETLTQCKALADDIDLVILDVFMPDGDMSTTLEHLHKLVPDARILLFSGTYLAPSAEATAAKLEELGAHGFLKKPFRQEKLQQKIHELIGPAVE